MSSTSPIHILAVNRTPVGKPHKNQPVAHGAAAFERLLTLNHAGVPVSVWPGSFVPEHNPASKCRSIKLRHVQLVAAFGDCPQSQRSIWLGTRFWSWFPLTRRPMICTHRERHWTRLGPALFTDTDRNQQLRLNISMETRILRLEDEFWRIRTDTGELADAERNALRAYLDEKGFKTAMIDDNLAIAGELTWKRGSLNPSRASTRARRTCIHSERGNIRLRHREDPAKRGREACCGCK